MTAFERLFECEGCLQPLDPVSLAGGYRVCFPCTKARHAGVLYGRCRCGSRRRESPEHQSGSRRWHTCLRCLATTRQVS